MRYLHLPCVRIAGSVEDCLSATKGTSTARKAPSHEKKAFPSILRISPTRSIPRMNGGPMIGVLSRTGRILISPEVSSSSSMCSQEKSRSWVSSINEARIRSMRTIRITTRIVTSASESTPPRIADIFPCEPSISTAMIASGLWIPRIHTGFRAAQRPSHRFSAAGPTKSRDASGARIASMSRIASDVSESAGSSIASSMSSWIARAMRLASAHCFLRGAYRSCLRIFGSSMPRSRASSQRSFQAKTSQVIGSAIARKPLNPIRSILLRM